MKKGSAHTPTNNVFKTMVHTVVREELAPVEQRLNRRMDLKFEELKEDVVDSVKNIMGQFRNDIATIKDEIITELKAVREEQTILSSQHSRVVDLEEKMEKLERIHPQGQRVPA
jgi:hypothetical protein